jgi:uracil-DNA glycosylase
MNVNIDIEILKEKLYAKLKPSGWDRILRGFIYSSEFDNILYHLIDDANNGKRFTPTLKNLFRAFEECPYEDLKVIIVGQDPYPQVNVADGIAFSCSGQEKIQPSLNFIYNELEKTVFPEGYTRNPDLKVWSNQGVLLLNTALTVTIGKISSHLKIWQPFITYLMDMLDHANTGLIYVYMGKKAEEWVSSVSDDNNYKIIVKHPAAAIYNKGIWDSEDLFNKVTKILKENYNYNMRW